MKLDFGESFYVKLLKHVPHQYRMKHVDAGKTVEAVMYPDGKITLIHPDGMTGMVDDARAGGDFDWIGEKPEFPKPCVSTSQGVWEQI